MSFSPWLVGFFSWLGGLVDGSAVAIPPVLVLTEASVPSYQLTEASVPSYQLMEVRPA